jgi:hypothetical protein
MTTLRSIKSISRSPSRLGFSLAALALACFALPTVARGDCGAPGGDILFTVTLLHPVHHGPNKHNCLFAKGPWGRISSGVNIGDLTVGQPCTFYAPDDNALNVYDLWEIAIYPNCLPLGVIPGLAEKNFFLLKRPANRVNITIDDVPNGKWHINVSTAGGVSSGVPAPQRGEAFGEMATGGTNTLEQNEAPSRTELSVKSWLGDSQDPSGRPDSDVFHFVGNAGDSVTLRLEADTRGGNNGGHATLRFVGPPARQVTGELPKRITVELGSTGRYDIAIEQAVGQGERRYRGGYFLTVESSQGDIQRLVPTDSVEK